MNFKQREELAKQAVSSITNEVNFKPTEDPYDGIDFIGFDYTLEVKTCNNISSATNIITAQKLFSIVQRSRKIEKTPIIAYVMPNQKQIRIYEIDTCEPFIKYYYETYMPTSEGNSRKVLTPHFRPRIMHNVWANPEGIFQGYKVFHIVASKHIF